MPECFLDETIQFLQLPHTLHCPLTSHFSQCLLNLLPQNRHVLRLGSKIEYGIRNQLCCCIDAQGSDEELRKGVQLRVIFICGVVRVVPEPFNRIEWLFVIALLLTGNSIS